MFEQTFSTSKVRPLLNSHWKSIKYDKTRVSVKFSMSGFVEDYICQMLNDEYNLKGQKNWIKFGWSIRLTCKTGGWASSATDVCLCGPPFTKIFLEHVLPCLRNCIGTFSAQASMACNAHQLLSSWKKTVYRRIKSDACTVMRLMAV